MLMFKPVAGTWYRSIIEPVDSELTAHQAITVFTVVIVWYVLSWYYMQKTDHNCANTDPGRLAGLSPIALLTTSDEHYTHSR